jgi:hypothetical protein
MEGTVKTVHLYGPARSATMLLVLAMTGLAAGVSAGASWQVEKAPIRFTLRLSEPPTHESAGYFATLPDGGILPTPFPLTEVVTAKSGKTLASYVLWHNRGSGLGLVFEAPGKAESDVHVYVSAANSLNLFVCGPDHRLHAGGGGPAQTGPCRTHGALPAASGT